MTQEAGEYRGFLVVSPAMTTAAIIVAAGRGIRAGAGVPKQYRLLAGRPLLAHTLAAFARHPGVSAVQAVIHEDDRAHYEQAALGLKLRPPVLGGATRQESVRRGLDALAAEMDEDAGR